MSMKNASWILAAVGGICLGVAGSGWSEIKPAVQPLTLTPIASPSDLSIAFREVSKLVLPSVVSIRTETKGRDVEITDSRGQPLNDMQEQMLRELFRQDPRFEQQFPRGGSSRRAPRQQGAGSGFIVDSSGIILTNSHVVEGADRVIVKLEDGSEVVADSWNFDPRTDIAIIRVTTDEPLPAVTLGDSDQMQVGDWVLALGNPFNVGTTVTSGIISATGRGPGINEREQYLQTDAAINPGNSGGPLVNLHGQVIGINTAISSRSGGYDGIGFSIPSKYVSWVANQLIADGEVKRSYLGVQLQEMTADIRKQLKVPTGTGALIVDVGADTPAARAELQAGDVIVGFDNRPIKDRDVLVDEVERSAPNKNYDLKVIRDGKETTLSVKLEEMPNDYTAALRRARVNDNTAQQPKKDRQEVSKLGLTIAELDDKLAGQLDIAKGTKGVVVQEVKAGSVAEEGGLQPGDLIQRVGTTEVNSIQEFGTAVSEADLSTGILLHIRRGNASSFVVLKPQD
ncbi:Do family serine endopeptidase [Planctomicrobium sp. SH668]|uniref:Do family serine endopeptidase n=1 Tax=Planctomicrobium sp. SH668 TaxID=3448126 RepID=UPI003F5C587A